MTVGKMNKNHITIYFLSLEIQDAMSENALSFQTHVKSRKRLLLGLCLLGECKGK